MIRKPVLFASGKRGQVIGCRRDPHHMIHVQFGNCTLTLTEEEFFDLSSMLTQASASIKHNDRGDGLDFGMLDRTN